MTNRPNNWYHMSYDEQRTWERQDREREELQYAKDQAEEALEKRRRTEQQLRREYRMEMDSAQAQRTELVEALHEVRRELRWAKQFIAHKGLTEDFKAWTEPDDEVIDEESFEE